MIKTMENNSSILCISRINAAIDALPAAERSIAEYVLTHYNEIGDCSCQNLAELTETSPATVVRFCRRIGYSGFNEFKISLTRKWLDQSAGIYDIRDSDTASEVKQKVLIFNKHVIDVLFETLDENALAKAAERIRHAGRILITGDGGAGSTAKVAYEVFMQLGLRCEYVEDIFHQIIVIGQMGPGDVLIAISNSGRTRNTIENTIQAKKRGVTTIGIIGMPKTPIEQYLDVELMTNVFSDDMFSDSIASRLCDLSTVSVLYSLLLRTADPEEVLDGDKLRNALDAKRVVKA